MSHPLVLHLLGPPGLSQDNEPLPLPRTQKGLALFFYLARQKDPISRDALSTLLYGDLPQQRARANVRVLLTRLKPISDYLIVTRQTIAFDRRKSHQIDVDQLLDTLQQLKLNSAGTTPLTPAEAEQLQTALALYRGEFLAGFQLSDAPDFEEWLLIERERLQQQVMLGLDALVNYHLQSGQLQAGLEQVERLLNLDNLREDAHRQKMLLLARSGQRTSALQHYQSCVDLFEDAFGVEPDPETQVLYARIREMEQADQRAEQVEPPAIPHNLPTDWLPFFGRRTETERIISRLQQPQCRLLTLQGPGGMGKTRLALAVGRQLLQNNAASTFPDGIFFVTLVGSTHTDEVPGRIDRTLNIGTHSDETSLAQLQAYLHQRRLLLILDNLEHLTGIAVLLLQILQAAPGIKMLVTSREQLAVQAEWVFDVGGLETPPTDHRGSLADFSATRLFLEHVQRLQNQFQPSDTERAAVSRICRLLGGMPLGIELAAALVPLLPPVAIATNLEESLDILTAQHQDTPARHRSLRVVFEQTWASLTTDEQRIFRTLAVFEGSFAIEAAAEITGTPLDRFSRLVAKSLLSQVEVGRYVIHPMLRQYAAEMLAAHHHEAETIRVAHAHYYSLLVQRHEDTLHHGKVSNSITTLKQDMDNILAAWQWAQQSETPPALAALQQATAGLALFYRLQGPFQDAAQLFAAAAEHCRPHSKTMAARLHTHQAYFLSHTGQSEAAIAAANQALQLAQSPTQAELCAPAYLERGRASWLHGQNEAARQDLQHALNLAESISNDAIIADCLLNLGQIAYYRHQHDEADRVLSRALTMFQQQGDLLGESNTLSVLGLLADSEGRWPDAERYYQQSLRLHQQIGNRHGEGQCYNRLANVPARQGNYEPAIVYYRQAEEIYQNLGYQRGLTTVNINLGAIYNEQSRYDLALEHYETALEMSRASNDRQGEGITLFNLGTVSRRLGQYASAKRYLQQSLQLAQNLRENWLESQALGLLGLTAHHQGKHQQAEDLCHQGLSRLADNQELHIRAYVLTWLGRALFSQHKYAAAEAAFHEAWQIRQNLGEPHRAIESLAGLMQTTFQRQHHAQAQAYLQEILSYLDHHNLQGTDDPQWVLHCCYQALKATRDPHAEAIRQRARTLMQHEAKHIHHPSLQRTFLNLPQHRYLHPPNA